MLIRRPRWQDVNDFQECLTFIGTDIHRSSTPLFNPASSDDVKKTAKTAIANRFCARHKLRSSVPTAIFSVRHLKFK